MCNNAFAHIKIFPSTQEKKMPPSVLFSKINTASFLPLAKFRSESLAVAARDPKTSYPTSTKQPLLPFILIKVQEWVNE